MKLTKRIKLERNKVPAWRHMPFGYYANRPHLLRNFEIGRYEGFRFIYDNLTVSCMPKVTVTA